MFRMSNSLTGAPDMNDMAHSSAMATTSRPRPNSYRVTISLSCNKSADRRTIDMAAGKTVQIGRSSKSGVKGLHASSTNALFDCAVVSRDHAELSMTSPWDTRPRVTITDKGSLHGTTVNGRKLDNGTPFELHTGDVIELGERITRGDDAHDGVSLTYKRLDPEPSAPRSPSPTMNRGYQVPESPDQEASDYDSDVDVDLESFYNYGNEESSAKTTPEQSRHKIGSQESPINLESAAGPSIVDLSQDDDEEDDTIIMAAASNKNNESLVIPETYDEDADPLVQESAPAVPAEMEQSAGYEQNLPESDDDEDDVESVRIHNTGLYQILIQRDGATSAIEESDHDDEYEAEKSEEEDVEYGYESIDDADGQSDSAASDLDNYGSEPESDLDEPSEVYSTARLQYEPSEPRDTEQSQQPLKTSTIHSVLSAEQPKPKAQYDPVRGSQHITAQDSTAYAPLANASIPSASAYVYGFPAFGSGYEVPATDFSDSSRWDVQPVPMPFGGGFSTHPYHTAPSYGAPTPFGATFTAPPMFGASQQVSTSGNSNNFGHSQPPVHNSSGMQTGMLGNVGNRPTSDASQLSTEAPSSKAAGKIAITDIVDENPRTTTQIADDAFAMIEEAKKMVAAASSSVANADTPSGKRKADEMDALPVTESPQQVTKKLKQESADQEIAGRSPATRPRSRGTVRRVATSAARYATAAAFGGAATIAFLSSPYAQSLIDFLG